MRYPFIYRKKGSVEGEFPIRQYENITDIG